MVPGLAWTAPFAVLLLSIATLPLFCKHWWEKYYPLVSFGLGLLVVGYYAIGLNDTHTLLHTAHEYASFIILIASLFIISGGIHINVKGEATPLVNCAFLLIGAFLANILGTTGASMVLIRPWIRMNKYRLTAFHIVFFIFIVSNVGGGLTPIGDPPLFLGYLKGVPFFWVIENVWTIWLPTVLALIAIFYVLDVRNFKRAPAEIRQKETGRDEEWSFLGIQNVFFLVVVIGAVFINNPPFLREFLMVAAAILSYKTTPKRVHEKNDFNFLPIKEVAILFAGIFATMMPALAWLEHNASSLGINAVGHFYWGSGILSSVLDNAPTYLNFLSAAMGLLTQEAGSEHAHIDKLLHVYPEYVRAISVGSVFFGAMTYIGNGPNFLVKSIADQAKVKTPSFFGYILRYSLPVLLPIYALIGLIFFKS